MHFSKPPSDPSGTNRMVLFLLAAGLVILAAAGVILYKRGTVPKKPEPRPAMEAILPAPLVIAEPMRPLQGERDAATEESAPASPRARRREAIGTIDAKAVNQFMNARFDQVRNCYERRLKANSFLEGKLDLNIDISTAGKVTGVTVNSDTVKDGEMLTCVKRTIGAWEFPRPVNGRVVIAKTFTFKKKS